MPFPFLICRESSEYLLWSDPVTDWKSIGQNQLQQPGMGNRLIWPWVSVKGIISYHREHHGSLHLFWIEREDWLWNENSENKSFLIMLKPELTDASHKTGNGARLSVGLPSNFELGIRMRKKAHPIAVERVQANTWFWGDLRRLHCQRSQKVTEMVQLKQITWGSIFQKYVYSSFMININFKFASFGSVWICRGQG